jgi:hypothetical protein
MSQFVPITAMIKTLSDYYDPRVAQQVQMNQINLQELKRAEEERKQLADIYRQNQMGNMIADAPTMPLQGMYNMTAAMGAPMAAAPIVKATLPEMPEIPKGTQADVMDKYKNFYMSRGRLDEALAIDKAQRLAAGGDATPTGMFVVNDDTGRRRAVTRVGTQFVDVNTGERVIADPNSIFTPGLAGQMNPDYQTAMADQAARLATSRTVATEKAVLPFDVAKEQRAYEDAVNQKIEAKNIAIQQKKEEYEMELPQKELEGLRKDEERFLNIAPVKWFSQARGSYGQFKAAVNATRDALAKGETRSAQEVAVLYGFVKAMDPNSAVREGEIALTDAARSLYDRVSTYAGRLEKGGTSNFTTKELDAFEKTVDGMMQEYSRGYNAEVDRFRQRNRITDPDQLDLYFPYSDLSEIGEKPVAGSRASYRQPAPDPTDADVMPAIPGSSTQTLYSETASGTVPVITPPPPIPFETDPNLDFQLQQNQAWKDQYNATAPSPFSMPATATVDPASAPAPISPASASTKIGRNIELIDRILGGK